MRYLFGTLLFFGTTAVSGAAFLAAGNAWRHDEPWLFMLCAGAGALCFYGVIWMAEHLGDVDDE